MRTCPVCLSHPGALPVPNAQAIEWTIKLGLALGCKIADRALFARKNYFYQDLPKGYQISQYEAPLCVGGRLVVPGPEGESEIRINRAHLEEDAAKTIHVGGVEGRIVGAEHSLVDFNRGGTPLMEIVSEPDIHSAEEAKRFLQLLRQTVVELGISDAEMEKGTLRCDANISVRPAGSSELRTRCELKNMNSFNFIGRGIEAEIARQIAVYESGGEVDAGDLRLRRRLGHADRAPLEGGGRGLPLLPRARPGALRARAGADRAAEEPSYRSCRARGSRGSSRCSATSRRSSWSRAAGTRSSRRSSKRERSRRRRRTCS